MQSKLRSQPKINQGFHSRRKKHEYIKKSPDPYFRKFGKGGKESISLWRCLLATTCLCQGGCLLKTTAPKRLTTVQEITCVLCRKCEPNQKSTASVRCASRKVNVIYASIHRNTLAAEDGRKLNVCILLSAVAQGKSSNRKNHTIVHPNARKNTCWLWAVQAQIFKLWLFVSAMDSRRNKVHNRIYHCSFTSRNVGRWDSCSQEFLEDWHRLGIELVFHIFPRSDFLWIHQIQQRTFMDETAERTQMRMHLWRPLHLWHPCS